MARKLKIAGLFAPAISTFIHRTTTHFISLFCYPHPYKNRSPQPITPPQFAPLYRTSSPLITVSTVLPWQMNSTFIMQFYFLSYKFKIPYIPNYLIIYFVPLPLPSIAITPFSHISFSNFVVFDFPKGIYGAISLIGFSIVLLKSL